MPRWTPEELRRVLDEGERAELQELTRRLTGAIKVGRGALLKRQIWLQFASLGEEDDIHEVLVALYDKNARILRRFGMSPAYRASEDALERYVMGVTMFTLRRRYQKRLPAQEEFLDDIAATDAWIGAARSLALRAALEGLSEDDRALFKMIFIEQLDTAEICERLGIGVEAYYARRSRLIKRLRELLAEGRT